MIQVFKVSLVNLQDISEGQAGSVADTFEARGPVGLVVEFLEPEAQEQGGGGAGEQGDGQHDATHAVESVKREKSSVKHGSMAEI